MKKIFAVSSILLLTLTACGGSKLASGKTLVDVNSEKITEGHLQFLSSLNPQIARQVANPFGKKQLLDNLVEQELLYQAAKKEGLHRDAGVKAKIDLYAKVILAQAFIETQGEKEAKKYYDEHQEEFERLGLAHIMIRYATPEEIKAAKKAKKKNNKLRTEPEALKLANQVYERLQKGEKFESLAKEFSEDELSKEQGGSFGPVSKNDPRLMRRGFQPLLEKGAALKVGEFAGPVKTTAGYHLITVTSPMEMSPFEEVKGQLSFKQRGEVRNKVLTELKEKGKVTYAEEQDAPRTTLQQGSGQARDEPKAAPSETPPNPQPQDHEHEQNPH